MESSQFSQVFQDSWPSRGDLLITYEAGNIQHVLAFSWEDLVGTGSTFKVQYLFVNGGFSYLIKEMCSTGFQSNPKKKRTQF